MSYNTAPWGILNETRQDTTLEPPPPSQDERTMATLAHALQIIGAWIAPLIFLISRKSRFVSFHALQALLLQVVHVILLVVFMIGWFVLIFSTVFAHAAAGSHPTEPPVAVFLLFPLVWLFLVGGSVTILIIAIVYSIKAGRGEWAEYPVLGKLARRMLKIGPRGTNQF